MPSLTDVYAHLNSFVQKGELPGAAIAISKDGAQVGEWHGGEARPGMRASPSTLWCVASISKTYSAAMIMALIERGVLTLGARAVEYFPRFTGSGRENITLRMLLTHTAGMIYESPDMEQRLNDKVPLHGLLEEALQSELLSPPGARQNYSDYHYLLAGMMAERATGKPFAQLVHEHVIAPLGLRDTFMPPPAGEYARIATVKAVMAEGGEGAMYGSPHAWSLAHPAFGTVSTVNDLLRFGMAFLDESPAARGFLSRATRLAMRIDQTGGHALGIHPAAPSPDPVPLPWGLGFYIQSPATPGVYGDLAPFGTFGHGGASGCQWVIDPHNNVVVALVSNLHARSGRDAWSHRLRSTLNMVWAALSA